MTGIELIAQERQEQIEKHGRTVLEDAVLNNDEQLLEAILLLLISHSPIYSEVKYPPKNWDVKIWHHMLQKDWHQKLAMIGAFAAAEIDRLDFVEANKEVEI